MKRENDKNSIEIRIMNLSAPSKQVIIDLCSSDEDDTDRKSRSTKQKSTVISTDASKRTSAHQDTVDLLEGNDDDNTNMNDVVYVQSFKATKSDIAHTEKSSTHHTSKIDSHCSKDLNCKTNFKKARFNSSQLHTIKNYECGVILYIESNNNYAADDAEITDGIMPLIQERIHGNFKSIQGTTTSTFNCFITCAGDKRKRRNWHTHQYNDSAEQQSEYVMCERGKSNNFDTSDSTTPELFECNFSSSFISNSTLLHLEQKETWSCGYRNTQMMLSALIPLLPCNHSYYEANPDQVGQSNQNYSNQMQYEEMISELNSTTIPNHSKLGLLESISNITLCYEIPCLQQIQSSLEQCWRDGYDPKGAEHYANHIRNRKSKIGAVEVSYYLLYNGIDSTVIQFTKCYASRALLGPFCSAYFTKQHQLSSPTPQYQSIQSQKKPLQSTCPYCSYVHHCSTESNVFMSGNMGGMNSPATATSTELAKDLLRIAGTPSFASGSTLVQFIREQSKESSSLSELSPNQTMDENENTGECTHSRSCCCDHPLLPLYLQWEGHSVTVVGVELRTNGTVKYLLVFDPIRDGKSAKNNLMNVPISPDDNCSGLGTFNRSKDIIHKSTQNTTEVFKKWIRLPCRKFDKKDCQIILPTSQYISSTYKEHIKLNGVPVLTAAHDDVVKAVKSHQDNFSYNFR